MKKISAIGIAIFVSLILVTAASAQKVGGYKQANPDAADVQSAAEFAISTQAQKSGKEMSLNGVVKADIQVVAGKNYRLCMQVDTEGGEGQDSVTINVQAVVYVDLKGNKKLSSWALSDCVDETGDGN